LARLIPYGRNPRKNDAAVDKMCAAIREFGFRIPVVARADGTVVDGHLRLKAAHSWVENPYYQLFRGEEFFRHKLTFDRSSPPPLTPALPHRRLSALDPYRRSPRPTTFSHRSWLPKAGPPQLNSRPSPHREL
jgi:hypothetical protein